MYYFAAYFESIFRDPSRISIYTSILSDSNFKRLRSRGTSEEDSDYAYIDRSTHSITGYLQSPTNTNIKKPITKDSNICDAIHPKNKLFGNGDVTDQTTTINLLLANSLETNMMDNNNSTEDRGRVEGMCSTTSFIDSPSPYATIQVMRKHRQQQKDILNQQHPLIEPANRQHNLIHQRPHPGGFHTLKVTKETLIIL